MFALTMVLQFMYLQGTRFHFTESIKQTINQSKASFNFLYTNSTTKTYLLSEETRKIHIK